ncbi:hypothetical protein [Bradyrhizobium sp. HKCCYLS3013]|uniref:hypothetical protein n=1 Tax=Bradyrhizobium sp. HKCCYLS3013 TaxID=3420735 RepID=UPI003EBBBF8E
MILMAKTVLESKLETAWSRFNECRAVINAESTVAKGAPTPRHPTTSAAIRALACIKLNDSTRVASCELVAELLALDAVLTRGEAFDAALDELNRSLADARRDGIADLVRWAGL